MPMYFTIDFLMTLLHYRLLIQTQNFGDVSSSVSSLLKPYDFLFFVDIILLIGLLAFKIVKIEVKDMNRRKVAAIILISFRNFMFKFGFSGRDRPQLLTRGFDRNYIVKYLGMYNYTIYDAVQSTKASAQRVIADSDDITEVINFTKSNYAEPNPEYFGAGKGKNVIYLHLRIDAKLP